MNYTFNARPSQQAADPRDRVVRVTITPAPAPRVVVVTREPDGSATAQTVCDRVEA